MPRTGRSCRVRFGFLLLTLFFLKQVKTEYNKDLCDKYSSDDDTDLTTSPYFFDDFEVTIEETVYSKDGEAEGEVFYQDMRYSLTHEQFEMVQTRKGSLSYFHVNAETDRCAYGDLSGGPICKVDQDQCATVKDKIGSVILHGAGSVHLMSSAVTMNWPTSTERKKNLGDSELRGLKTKKYVTCTYVSYEDTTVVSEWHVLDTDNYNSIDGTKNIVLMSHHHRSKDQDPIKSRRMDYFRYKKLSKSELRYGIPINRDHCAEVTTDATLELPTVPPRFSVVREVDHYSSDSEQGSFTRYDQTLEYNSMAQFIWIKNHHDTDENNERDISYKYTDFSSLHGYEFSKASGECTIVPPGRLSYGTSMPAAASMFGKVDNNFGDVFEVRDIPCSYWIGRNENNKFQRLYLASKTWLKDQGRDENEFYPVMSWVDLGDRKTRIESYYELKVKPGYHVPYIKQCFEPETKIHTTLILLIDFHEIKDHRIHMDYEFRSLLKKITGIKSSLRIAEIYFYGSKSVGETMAYVTLLGDAKGIDRSETAYYMTDPVTSQEAADKIKDAVDSGEWTFNFEKEKKTIKFKKGSFAIYEYKSKAALSDDGHSSGAMAAVGMVMILVGLALGSGLMYGYKRWKQGALPALSFTFGKDGIKGSP